MLPPARESGASYRLPPFTFSKASVHRSLFSEVSNWARVESAWILSRLGRMPRAGVSLHFRDRTASYQASDPRALNFAVVSVHLASCLSAGTVSEDVRALCALRDGATRALLEAYPTDWVEQYFTGGGFPSSKDSLLWLIARRTRPQQVVETGVAQGVSSLFILDALDRNGSGRLTSIDYPDKMAIDRHDVERSSARIVGPCFIDPAKEPGWLVPNRLRSKWKLELGPAQDILPRMECSLDMFLHDSLHTYDHMMFEFRWVDRNSRFGTVLVSDDITWNSAFSDFLSERVGRWLPITARWVGVAVRT